uniref:Uncharacterized protein n=2 Tax=unclassified Caudoviricetes TaxID=2788787 RepID=A0A8S5M3E6_9CAUD|nr:MAG TPA: hypothetical protein [Siphoviridae sp. ctQJR51]DAD76718.1 MAG TPA: hypothetical protein [Siphoviridae sp. ctQJR51]DAF96547.1 MAG TPA: hypothetical protein [Siphoviridae sp. ctHj524]DAF96550.1 MAG TPA: hypothetical protein [Siphoviridae sp. ctHj524]
MSPSFRQKTLCHSVSQDRNFFRFALQCGMLFVFSNS